MNQTKNRQMEIGHVISQDMLLDGIYSLYVECHAADLARMGQFVSLYSRDGSKILPRPISICEIDRASHTLRFVYRVVGQGTEEFSSLKKGDEIRLLGPLGNGFPEVDGPVVLVGGGIGVPPMLETAKTFRAAGRSQSEVISVMGYRDKTFLQEEFEKYSTMYIATDDGSTGIHGTVVDALRSEGITRGTILACGPKPMLRALRDYAREHDMTCFISMEERMACGIGACLGCVCKTKNVDDHSKVHNTRICKDGPVFLAEEVEL